MTFVGISIHIEEVEDTTMLVQVSTAAGPIDLIGEVVKVGRELTVDRLHIQGLKLGSLGRPGLNAIARHIMEQADADSLVILGGIRTTGKNPGRRPRTVRFDR